jgi:ribosome maturation factor RimP
MLERVRAVVEPITRVHGIKLFDVEWLGSDHGHILRLTIEREVVLDGDEITAAVTVADCARVSRDASTALDVEEVLDENYNLEVSSPGLDRPLVTAQDFLRQVGKLAKVRLSSPSHDGQCVLRGTIAVVTEETVSMDVDGNQHVFALGAVERARLVFEIGQQEKGHGPKTKQKWAPKKSNAKRQSRKQLSRN